MGEASLDHDVSGVGYETKLGFLRQTDKYPCKKLLQNIR